MATEKAQRMIFDEADTEPLESLPSAAALAAELQKGSIDEPPAGTLVVLDQERRLLAVREMNNKLGDLEHTVSRLSSAFGQSQQSINNTLLDIQRRSARMTADMLALASRADKDSEQHRAAAAALDARLKAGMVELREQLTQATAALRNQHGRLDQLESGQKSLLKLHDGLALMGRQHGDAIQNLNLESRQHGRQLQALGAESRQQAEALQGLGAESLRHGDSIKVLHAGAKQQSEALRALTSEAREQLQVNRTHISGLQALHREQKQALQALATDFDALVERTDMLTDKLQGLSTEVAEERLWVRKGFKAAGGALAAVAVIAFAVMAYLQWHPVTVPETVRSEIAGLSAAVNKQTAVQQSMAADMQAMQGRIAAIGESADVQATEMTRLQGEVQHSMSVLHRIRKSEAAIRREVGGLEGRVDKVEQVQSTHPAG